MIESSTVKRTHQIATLNEKKKIAIDATCGNGYDSIFLSSIYEKVISIDIQELAIKRTKEKTKDIANIEVFCDDFNYIEKYQYANFILFNLGFLPGSNRKVKTQDYTSNEAILKAYSILDGTLCVACYIQHEGGFDEYQKIIQTLDENHINYVIEPQTDNKEILIIIKK